MKYKILEQGVENVREEASKQLKNNFQKIQDMTEQRITYEQYKQIYHIFIEYTWGNSDKEELEYAVETIAKIQDELGLEQNTVQDIDAKSSNFLSQRLKNLQKDTSHQEASRILQLYALGHPSYTLKDAKSAEKYLKQNYTDTEVYLRIPAF